MRNYLFVKNYCISEGAVSHNVLYYHQLPVACYQVRCYANIYFEQLPNMYSAFNSAFSFNYWPIASKKTWGPVITLSKASWPVQCLKASIVNFSFPSFKARGILTCPLLLLSLAQFHKDFRHSANFFAYFNIKTSIFVKQRFIV